ncbi:SDR family NAD(P)-dependent oxidoreductase [Salibacterium aidingense]|uniref:SDR family NAD(P)-dependent oxidoreductase n=1 Tax=Salibacterium aidingense TaxID=384933 RepID=UPI003BDED325
MYSLSNKKIVITGAASGIGKEAAIQFTKAGAETALLDRDDLSGVVQSLQSKGRKVFSYAADVSNPEQMENSFSRIAGYWGQIDGVFANAGINGRLAPIENLTSEDWDLTLAVNLKSTFLSLKYAIPSMKESGGSIVITSSINGNRTFSSLGMSAYSTSKAGQTALAKMAAVELAPYNIRVNAVCPGGVETNIGERTYPDEEHLQELRARHQKAAEPPGRNAPPEKITNVAAFLLSDASNHLSGTEMYIDGASSLF